MSSMKKLKCMYTRHLVKKRKSWCDGYLKIVIERNSATCTLIDLNDVRQIGLESRPLEPAEMCKINRREEFTIEMENYLVEIEHYGEDEMPSSQPPLKLPKFVVPKTVTPKAALQQQSTPSGYATLNSSASYNRVVPQSSDSWIGGKSYKVNSAELDDIWGGGSGDVMTAKNSRQHVNSQVSVIAGGSNKETVPERFSSRYGNVDNSVNFVSSRLQSGAVNHSVECKSSGRVERMANSVHSGAADGVFVEFPSNHTFSESVWDSTTLLSTQQPPSQLSGQFSFKPTAVETRHASIPAALPGVIDASIWDD